MSHDRVMKALRNTLIHLTVFGFGILLIRNLGGFGAGITVGACCGIVGILWYLSGEAKDEPERRCRHCGKV